jgi:enoyl-CoA hydratase
MSLLEVQHGDGVVTLTLNDPDRRNSLSPPLVDLLCHELDVAEQSEDTSVVVITGNGRAFCAGADISKLGSHGPEDLRSVYRAFTRVANSPLLTIAAVNGPAVGAGMNLALASDIRVAGESARFECRFLSIGLHPGGGHIWMLQRAVGPQAAAAMVLASQNVGGAEAERVGLVWKCVPDGALLEEAQSLAASAAGNPRKLERRAKSTFRESEGITNHNDAIDLELEAQVWSMGQPDFAERLAALQTKIAERH